MEKFCDALGLFFSDAETNKLVDAFARNMVSPSPVLRRTVTDAIVSICRGSRRPFHYLTVRFLLTVVLKVVGDVLVVAFEIFDVIQRYHSFSLICNKVTHLSN
jgi:hypothetical protein